MAHIGGQWTLVTAAATWGIIDRWSYRRTRSEKYNFTDAAQLRRWRLTSRLGRLNHDKQNKGVLSLLGGLRIGMSAQAEVTHRRRVVDYFLSPLPKRADEAGREMNPATLSRFLQLKPASAVVLASLTLSCGKGDTAPQVIDAPLNYNLRDDRLIFVLYSHADQDDDSVASSIGTLLGAQSVIWTERKRVAQACEPRTSPSSPKSVEE